MNMEPSAPLKFGLAIFQVGFGFAILVYGSSFAGPDGKVAVIWLALMYLFHTTGELLSFPGWSGDGYAPECKPSRRNDDGSLVPVQFICSLLRRCNKGAMAIEGDNSSVSVGTESLSIYMDVLTVRRLRNASRFRTYADISPY